MPLRHQRLGLHGVFEGVFYTREGEFASIPMTPADGVALRTQKALQHLHTLFPDEDWGYYLDADGSVRWARPATHTG